MSTSASNTIDWDELTGLFRPGRGAMPPKLAGRDSAQSILAILLNDISKRNRAPTGRCRTVWPARQRHKTVLLDAFIQQCKGADVISLVPTQIKNEEDLAALLLYEDQGFRKQLEEFKPSSGEIDLKLFSVQWGKMSKSDRDDHTRRHLVDLLVARCRNKPLVVTLDEAHTLDPEVGRTLLNASQLAQRKGARFLLAIAGTPNLRTRLNQMQSTFWNRSKKSGWGRLDAGTTRAALEEPLESYGIAFDEDALDTVIAESQYYPYFIQLWGEVLCQGTGREGINPHRHVGSGYGAPNVYRSQNRLLQGSLPGDGQSGLAGAGTICCRAPAGAGQCAAQDTERTPDAELSLGPQAALAVIGQLSDLGLIWQPAPATAMKPGSPAHVLCARRRRRLYRRASLWSSYRSR